MSQILFYENETYDDAITYDGSQYLDIGSVGNQQANGSNEEIFGGAPEISFDNMLFFEGPDGSNTPDLKIYDFATDMTTTYQFGASKAWSSGLDPQDMVAYNKKVYFVGDGASDALIDPGFELFSTKGGSNTLKNTKEVANSPLVNGQLAAYRGNLLMNATDSSGDHDLAAFNPSSGFSVVEGGTNVNPLDTLEAKVFGGADLFFNGSSTFEAGGLQLLANTNFDNHGKLDVYDGTSVSVLAKHLDPEDLTAVTFVSNGHSKTDVFFNGIDPEGGRGLFEISPGKGVDNLKVTEIAGPSLSNGAQGDAGIGLDPTSLTNDDGVLYFAGADGTQGFQENDAEGLWSYNPATSQLSEVFKGSTFDLGPQSTIELGGCTMNMPSVMSVVDGKLDFFASVDAALTHQLVSYDTSSGSWTVHTGTSGINPIAANT